MYKKHENKLIWNLASKPMNLFLRYFHQTYIFGKNTCKIIYYTTICNPTILFILKPYIKTILNFFTNKILKIIC